MSDAQVRTRDRMLWRVVIALSQGVLLWWLFRSIADETWPATNKGWLVGLITPVILLPVAHYLLIDVGRDRRGLWVLPAIGILLFGIGWHHGAWTAAEPYQEFISFAPAVVVLIFHALPFVQSWLATGRLRPDYPDLFQFAWRNTLLVAFGGVFCGVFWLLLWLWGALFQMIGVTFFVDLFTEALFAMPATAIAVGVGMQLVGSVERLQTALRQQLLTMLKWLAPLAILILALFTIALLVKSPDLFLEQRRVISAAWLLWLVVLTVGLLNAAYQDGRTESPYPNWLGVALRWVVPLLVPVALLAIYAIGVRAQSYGLTVARAWAMLVALIALAYAAGYAWAAWRRTAWMAGMGVVNVGIALATIVLLTLMLSPVLSPERLAASSQYARVLEDKDAVVDAMRYLRFNSGRYGRRRLERLATLEGHPDSAAIQAAAKTELERQHPWYEAKREYELGAESFDVFPAGESLEPGLLASIRESNAFGIDNECLPADPCPMLIADLNRDNVAEALIFGDYATVAATRESKGWTMIQLTRRLGEGRSLSYQESIRQALAEGKYEIRDLPWQVLVIGNDTFIPGEPKEGAALSLDSIVD